MFCCTEVPEKQNFIPQCMTHANKEVTTKADLTVLLLADVIAAVITHKKSHRL